MSQNTTVDEFLKYEAYQKRRLSAKPGITGMWQVSGRNSMQGRLNKIYQIMKTIKRFIKGEDNNVISI